MCHKPFFGHLSIYGKIYYFIFSSRPAIFFPPGRLWCDHRKYTASNKNETHRFQFKQFHTILNAYLSSYGLKFGKHFFFWWGTNDIHANDAGGSKSPMRHNIKYSTISRHLVLSFSFALLAHFNAISFVFFYVLTFCFALHAPTLFTSLRHEYASKSHAIRYIAIEWIGKVLLFSCTHNLSFNEKTEPFHMSSSDPIC